MMQHRANNMILLKIYFGKMSYQKLEEKVAYSVFDMIGLFDPTSDTIISVHHCQSKFSLNLQPAWEERWVSALERVYSQSVNSSNTEYWHWYMPSADVNRNLTKLK